MAIIDGLFEIRDEEYADFQVKLTPGLVRENCIGVRLPVLRKFAKDIKNDPEVEDFLNALPHKYFDENMLHGVILSKMSDYEACIRAVDEFLPYVDNWAVCDTLSPKIFKKNTKNLIEKIYEWVASPLPYTKRFGMEMLMSFYLDDEFKPEYLNIPAGVVSDEYYVNMMIAWFFATALAKQWDDTIIYIEENRLEKWTHNKTIQKAVESYRISEEQKEYLKKLRIK